MQWLRRMVRNWNWNWVQRQNWMFTTSKWASGRRRENRCCNAENMLWIAASNSNYSKLLSNFVLLLLFASSTSFSPAIVNFCTSIAVSKTSFRQWWRWKRKRKLLKIVIDFIVEINNKTDRKNKRARERKKEKESKRTVMEKSITYWCTRKTNVVIYVEEEQT